VLSPDKVYVITSFSSHSIRLTRILLSHFDYITSRRQGSVYVRKSYTVEVYPEDLKSKVYLLKHFEKYIMDRLYGEYDYTFEDVAREKGMELVQKYLRMKNVIVFKLSHDVLQVRFSISMVIPSILLTLFHSRCVVQLLRPLQAHPLVAWATRHPHRQAI